jgi:hypothetical protein
MNLVVVLVLKFADEHAAGDSANFRTSTLAGAANSPYKVF